MLKSNAYLFFTPRFEFGEPQSVACDVTFVQMPQFCENQLHEARLILIRDEVGGELPDGPDIYRRACTY